MDNAALTKTEEHYIDSIAGKFRSIEIIKNNLEGIDICRRFSNKLFSTGRDNVDKCAQNTGILTSWIVIPRLKKLRRDFIGDAMRT